MIDRRQFIKIGAAGAALFSVRRRAYGWNSPALTKFKDSLPGLTKAGANNLGQFIPVATSSKMKYAGRQVDHFQIGMVEHSEQMHSELRPTRLWGYVDRAAGDSAHYLGPAIVAQKDNPVVVTYSNDLPGRHLLPVDITLPGAEGAPNRAVPHLHGGFVPWTSDGGPFSWFTPGNGPTGPSFSGRDFYYPNQQSARLMWFHDHAMGNTRLNAYAGLAAPYVLRDNFEERLIHKKLIPDHDAEIPLVIQDKLFASDGSLAYPSVYEKSSEGGAFDYGPEADPPAKLPPGKETLPLPSAVPEMFGDTILVNGTAYPFLALAPGVYRFRILNGSNARFFNLNLFYESSSRRGQADLGKAGPPIVQIGTEGGFLPQAVVLNRPPRLMAFDTNESSPTSGNATRYNLLLAPAERADVLIDLTGVASGSQLILYNDAPAPFPMGDPVGEQQDRGPDVATLLQIRIVAPSSKSQGPKALRIDLPLLNLALAENWAGQSLLERPSRFRPLTLNEDFDDYGRLIQRLGTNVSPGKNNQGLVTFSRNYEDAPTEIVKAGDFEVWEIYNLSADTHPMHFHLVNVQVVGRRPFDVENYNGRPKFTGPWRAPDPNERGWKETVRMNPNEVTAVKMRFDLPKVPFDVPPSPRFQEFKGLKAHEYVWHCHILEHEEHDMMRPLAVVP